MNYISIVVTTRNDNHGGDLIERTKCFTEGVYVQAEKHGLRVELIIVEWNPPTDRPLLKDVLPQPPKSSGVTLRYVIVPESIHRTYSFASRMPLFQMTAKNVGIRRATAPFVLCTNIDLLFSDELFYFIANATLKENVFYRANRFDVKNDLLNIEGFENKLSFAKNNVLKRLGKSRGHEYLVGFPGFLFAFKNSMLLLNYLIKKALSSIISKESFLLRSLDTFACGDFTLMARSNWIQIEGYPELDLYSIHIDSMGLIAATALGMEQEILPAEMCSFHIHHQDGWESFSENPIGLIKFMERRPGLDWYTVWETGKWLIKNKRGWGLNKPDWGFDNTLLKEYIFEPGEAAIEIN